jgi:hypothetical protein
MIIRREALKACLVATDAHETRYNLDAVQVLPDGRLVATDGHLLLVARDKEPMKDEDFPSKDVPAFKGSPKTPVALPKAVVLKLIAAMPKGGTIPILGATQVGTNGNGAYAVATDLETPLVATLPAPDAFPDWPKVVPPANRKHLTLILTGTMLQQLAKAAAAVNGKYVRLELPIDKKHHDERTIVDAVRVVISGDEVDIEGAAMPCRV